MKIIDDNIEFIASVERYFSFIKMPSKANDFTYINASVVTNINDKRLDRKGILEAYELIQKGENIAIYSFENPQYLYSLKNNKNKEFMNVMSKEQSIFLRLPKFAEELDAEFAEPKYHNLAMDLASNSAISENIAGQLLHTIDGTGVPKTATLARQSLAIDGADDEVIMQLYKLREKGHKILYDKLIPGLFVDVEGTLVPDITEMKINDSVLEKIINYSKTGPVTIWTGGELKKIQDIVGPLLTIASIENNSRIYTRTAILSKHDFRGCEVESVIDDSPQEKLSEDYEITAQKYERVKK